MSNRKETEGRGKGLRQKALSLLNKMSRKQNSTLVPPPPPPPPPPQQQKHAKMSAMTSKRVQPNSVAKQVNNKQVPTVAKDASNRAHGQGPSQQHKHDGSMMSELMAAMAAKKAGALQGPNMSINKRSSKGPRSSSPKRQGPSKEVPRISESLQTEALSQQQQSKAQNISRSNEPNSVVSRLNAQDMSNNRRGSISGRTSDSEQDQRQPESRWGSSSLSEHDRQSLPHSKADLVRFPDLLREVHEALAEKLRQSHPQSQQQESIAPRQDGRTSLMWWGSGILTEEDKASRAGLARYFPQLVPEVERDAAKTAQASVTQSQQQQSKAQNISRPNESNSVVSRQDAPDMSNNRRGSISQRTSFSEQDQRCPVSRWSSSSVSEHDRQSLSDSLDARFQGLLRDAHKDFGEKGRQSDTQSQQQQSKAPRQDVRTSLTEYEKASRASLAEFLSLTEPLPEVERDAAKIAQQSETQSQQQQSKAQNISRPNESNSVVSRQDAPNMSNNRRGSISQRTRFSEQDQRCPVSRRSSSSVSEHDRQSLSDSLDVRFQALLRDAHKDLGEKGRQSDTQSQQQQSKAPRQDGRTSLTEYEKARRASLAEFLSLTEPLPEVERDAAKIAQQSETLEFFLSTKEKQRELCEKIMTEYAKRSQERSTWMAKCKDRTMTQQDFKKYDEQFLAWKAKSDIHLAEFNRQIAELKAETQKQQSKAQNISRPNESNSVISRQNSQDMTNNQRSSIIQQNSVSEHHRRSSVVSRSWSSASQHDQRSIPDSPVNSTPPKQGSIDFERKRSVIEGQENKSSSSLSNQNLPTDRTGMSTFMGTKASGRVLRQQALDALNNQRTSRQSSVTVPDHHDSLRIQSSNRSTETAQQADIFRMKRLPSPPSPPQQYPQRYVMASNEAERNSLQHKIDNREQRQRRTDDMLA